MTYKDIYFLVDNERRFFARSRVAENAIQRARGLLFSRALGNHEAMLIPKCCAVHTWFMTYAIDIVYLDRSGVVKKIVHHLKPWRFSGSIGADAVIEVLAGEAYDKGLFVGAKIEKD